MIKVVPVRSGVKVEAIKSSVPVTINVVAAGPAGPRGADGPAGSVADYTHVQGTAAASWTVNHNLGRRPTITVFSVGGAEVLASVTHTSLNQAIIGFASPQAGSARCL